MNSDAAKAPKDVVWKPAGVGMAPMFRCAECSQPRSTTGRKLKRVMGLKTWVCRYCCEGK